MSGPRLRDVTNDAPAPRPRKRAKWDPPAWLSAPGKAAFRALLQEAERSRPGLLDRVDVPTLALMAEHYAIAQAASKVMRGTGNVPSVLEVDAVHGGHLRKTPAWQVYREASTSFVAMAREFGFTLKSRTMLELGDGGLPLPDDQDDEGDLEDAL